MYWQSYLVAAEPLQLLMTVQLGLLLGLHFCSLYMHRLSFTPGTSADTF